jgi:hypothetical protein
MGGGFGWDEAVHDRGWHYLAVMDPDIALLQETVPPAWAREKWVVFHAPTYDTGDWGSAVAVKDFPAWEPEFDEKHVWLTRYHGAVIVVTIMVDMKELLVASVHARAKSIPDDDLEGVDRADLTYGKSDKVWPLYAIYHDLMRFLPERNFVAGGDLNAARLMDEVYGPDDPSFGGNKQFFDQLEQSGFSNCMAKFHKSEIQTYFKDGKRPYQLDHLHCSAALRSSLISCQVLTHPVEALSLSDHAPIVAEFER